MEEHPEPDGGDAGTDPASRGALQVLRMVGELHRLGYQKARISPGMSPSGMYWRCLVTPASNILRSHGALMWANSEDIVAIYTTGQGEECFGWKDAPGATARQLADLFIERFPTIATLSLGADWVYAGWYVQMLGIAEAGHFPMAYNDWEDLSNANHLPTIGPGGTDGSPRLPLPPRGLAGPDSA